MVVAKCVAAPSAISGLGLKPLNHACHGLMYDVTTATLRDKLPECDEAAEPRSQKFRTVVGLLRGCRTELRSDVHPQSEVSVVGRSASVAMGASP